MSHKNYQMARWARLRAKQLRENPLCVFCLRQGRTTAATVADHITPHRGNEDLFWDGDNLQSLCATCHSAGKQLEEIHGFTAAADVDGVPIDPAHPWNCY